MESNMNEDMLLKNGFKINKRYSSDTFKYYEKGELILEQSIMSFFKKENGKKKYLWDLRKRIDGNNSEFIATVENFEDVSKFIV